MELDHFSHKHSLTSLESQNTNSDAWKTYCSGCLGSISKESSYGCTQCDYFLHKKCAELPAEISHPLHRRHPLLLQSNHEELICALCFCSGSLVYHCSICEFSLDIECAEVLPPVIRSQTHEHPFTLLCKEVSFDCDACGEDGSHSPYVCISCNLTVHYHCISLPRAIRITRHEHLLRHTYFLHEWRPCSICHINLSENHGCYHCPACDYAVHVHCATHSDIRDDTTRDEEDDTESSEARVDSIIRIVKEIKLGEDMIAAEIEHFSHEHTLSFSNVGKDNKCCDGCGIRILSPFYCCEGCDFFLHKTCTELPRNKLYPLHQHTLTLRPKSPHSSRVFACKVCSIYSNGFSYNCERCSFDIDLRCSSISDTLIHQAHEHSLFVLFGIDGVRECNGCGASGKNGLECSQCDYGLHFKCATLPLTAMHSYDDHPLKLTFQDDSDSDMLYCDVCEDERNPDNWFYSCDDCGVTIHPECLLGKYPYIKVGDAYATDSHPHSLRFVKKTEKYPACNSCSQPCTDLALECAEPECSFIVHWECVAPNKS
ncbi:uncharacterized protein LOC110820692 [Carica papaya]|uniref:uncharacterized protein LOC110820692 n=1 Tax=Carica papaya TaxID=3649 RepID=UPI000B8CAD83|nr:uncharacterized protein LOC110820692 [Carica papaya]